MPNWCTNIVRIVCADETAAAALGVADAINEVGSFINAVDPFDPWDHDEAIQRWRTKWADEQTEAYADGRYVDLRFDTAWCTPWKAIETAASKWSALIGCAYYEGGNQDYGWYINGPSGLIIDVDGGLPVSTPYPDDATDDEIDEWWEEWHDNEQSFIEGYTENMYENLDAEAERWYNRA